MNAPKLRFKDENWQTNSDWAIVFLEDLISEIYQGLNTTSDLKYTSDGIPFLQAKHITHGYIDKNDIKYLDNEIYSKQKTKYSPNKNNILFTNRGTIGKSLFIDEKCDFMIAWNIMIIKVDETKINAFLLYSFISHLEEKGLLMALQTGNATKFIKKETLLNLKIAIPTKRAEQNKMGSFFNLLNKKIEIHQEKIKELVELKKGVMQKIFSQELRFKDENGGEFGVWEEKLLNEISIINPKSGSINNEFYYIDLDAVVKGSIKNLKTVFLENAPSRAQRVLKEKDVLFQTVRPYQQNHFYVENLYDKQTVASTGFAQIRTKENARYVYYLLHNETFAQKVMDRCTGTSYPAINSKHLGEIIVPVPSLLEQEKISKFLSLIDKKIKIEKEKLKMLLIQKKGFMQQMFI